ncbi:MAG: hydantoinase B/oxoprolinase family protein [Planctomycetota bacterium]
MDESGFDAVELEVFRQLLAAVAEEMGFRLMRSAFSPNIKERRDYSCALFDARGDMIAQAAHIPVHLGSAPASVKAILEAFPAAAMRLGDRFIVNDPFAGGTHLPDITVVAPCFVDGINTPGPGSGGIAPRFFVANRAHHADVGGKTPGSMPIGTSIDDEGIRIPPSRLDEALIATIATQSRTPDERRGDLRAQCAALDAGIARLEELCVTHGPQRLADAGQALQDYAARYIASLIRDTPDGTYRFEDVMEDDGHGHTDLHIRCTLTVTGDRATFDFRDTVDQTLGPVNAVRAIVLSAVLYGLRCLAPAELPSNSGILRPVEVLTRPGSLVDAQPPAAVAGGNVETSQRLVDVVFGTLAQVLPGRVPAASCGSMNNLLIGSVGGDTTGPPFAYYETIGGGIGAGPGQPGGDALHAHMTNTLNTPIEALEHSYPFRVTSYAVRRGSGGRGQAPGGDGIVRRYVFDRPAEVTLLTERRATRPYGLGGGESGRPGEARLVRPDGRSEILPAKCGFRVEPGDRLDVMTPGGGGWGPPTATSATGA